MIRRFSLSERLFALTGRLLLGILAVCCLTETACPQVNPALPAYDVTPRPIAQIAPGTVVDRTPPAGWTHLIIKSRGRLAAGDLHKATEQMKELTSLLFTVVVARVQPEQAGGRTRYRLGEIAAGLGTTIKGRDIVITPDTQQSLGANLGFLAGLLLAEGHKRARDVWVMARSETMVVVDAPAILNFDGKHRWMILRYALLVDEQTGQLYTLLWPIGRDARGAYTGVIGPFQWLPTNKVEENIIHLDGSEINFAGIPSEVAFAMLQIPQGQMQIPIPEAVKPLASRGRLSGAMAAELEKNLREIVRQAATR